VPLSGHTHRLFATPPAPHWLAFGEDSDRVTFVTHTRHDWRLAAVQATHELVEAFRHHHEGVTREQLDAYDAANLDAHHNAQSTHAHRTASYIEMILALSLGVPLPVYRETMRGLLTEPLVAPLRVDPVQAPMLSAVITPQRRPDVKYTAS
jgi:hypothetical protein